MRLDDASDEEPLPFGVGVPHGATLNSIVHSYGPLPEPVPCSLPSCHTPNKKGFVVAFSRPDGLSGEAMVGHICGRNHFGESWKKALTLYRARERVATIQRQMLDCLRAADDVSPQLDALLPVLESVQHIRNALRTAVPQLFRLCADAVRSRGGVLAPASADASGPRFRLKGGGFYVRDNAWRAASRLSKDIASIRYMASKEAVNIASLGVTVSKVGNISQRFREVEQEAWEDIEALRILHFAQVVRTFCDLTGTQDLWLRGTRLEAYVRDWASGAETWGKTVDLGPIQVALRSVPGGKAA